MDMRGPIEPKYLVSKLALLESKYLVSKPCSSSGIHCPKMSQLPISSIKGEVKKKHFTHGRMFFCSPARPVEQDCSRFPFLDLGTLLKSCSAFGFLYQRFSSPLHDEASLF